jgi:hypothetical protein
MGVKGNSYRVSVANIEGKRRLGRLRHKWKAIIKMYLENGSVFSGFVWLMIHTTGRLWTQ